MVTNLDPTSRVLQNNFENAVSRFVDTPYSVLDGKLDALLNMVPNDWEGVAARLRAAQILKS